MKNVLYIGGFSLPDKNAAAQRVFGNAKVFEALGYDVYLLGQGEETAPFVYDGVKCRNLKRPNSLFSWYRYITTIKSIIPFVKKINPSYIIAYNFPALALKKLLNYCKSNNIKLIADCTEWYTPEGNPLFKIVKGWDTQKRMKDVHPKLDGIIVISRYLHDFYNRYGSKLIVLPPLVDIEQKKWKIESEKNEDGSLKLVYAGSPGHKDRLDTIVKTLAAVRNKKIVFTIIGLNELQFRYLYNYNDAIPDGVQFMGRIPHEMVLAELKKADFQIFIREDNLTTRAGFPTKFVESISARLPVLTNLTSNIGDYLMDGTNGFELDVSSNAGLQNSLLNVLQKNRSEISIVKENIDIHTFDYRRYITLMKEFLESL